MSNHPFSDLRSIQTLQDIMQALRTPGTGCPWDLEQDFSSIAPYTIEEAYEVADAIERGNMDDLLDELGDLLLQAIYHSQMAREQSAFTFEDVVEGICAKMIRRHPHVFGDAEAKTAGAVKGFWEKIKAQEDAARATRQPGSASVLDGIPVALPALARAVKLQRRAARIGFDWPEIEPVIDKIEEEIAELKVEIASGHRKRAEEELGDLMFALANLARHLRIEPEAALQSANAKFSRRFKSVETKLSENRIAADDATLPEMEALWEEVKSEEQK